MTSPEPKSFDCVESMRRERDRISREIADLDHDGLIQWLRSHRYASPILQQLADRATRRTYAVGEPPPESA